MNRTTRVLIRMGVRFSGIYDEDGELVDIDIRMTWIRRFLNWFWNKWRFHIGEDERYYGAKDDGDWPDYLPYRLEEEKT